ncbi:MAG TPA: hypothetical protein VIM73_04005 [Polyangiaceae bacterium]
MDLRKVILVAVGGAVAGVGGWWATSMHKSNEQRLRTLEQEMETKLSAARTNALVVHANAATPVRRPSPALAPIRDAELGEAAPEARKASDPAPVDPASEITSEEEYYFKVGMAFSAETQDPAWARETEYTLNKALSEVAETSTAGKLECRQSLCRVSLEYADQEKFSAFIDRMVGRANEIWTGEITWHRDSVGDDGAVRSTIYFGRPGVSINALALAQ